MKKTVMLLVVALSLFAFVGSAFAAEVGHIPTDNVDVTEVTITPVTISSETLQNIADALFAELVGVTYDTDVTLEQLPAGMVSSLITALADYFSEIDGRNITNVEAALLPLFQIVAGDVAVIEFSTDAILDALDLVSAQLDDLGVLAQKKGGGVGALERVTEFADGSRAMATDDFEAMAAGLKEDAYAFVNEDGEIVNTFKKGENVIMVMNIQENSPYNMSNTAGVVETQVSIARGYEASSGGGSSGVCNVGGALPVLALLGVALLGKKRK